MRKRIIALAALFIITAALGGCKENGGQNGQENQSETTAASAQVTEPDESETEAAGTESAEAAAETSAAETKNTEDEPFRVNLQGLNVSIRNELLDKLAKLKDEDGNDYFVPDATGSVFHVISGDEIGVGRTSTQNAFAADLYRESTTMLCTDEEQSESFYAAADSMKRDRYSAQLSHLDVNEKQTVLKISYDENYEPKIEKITYGYTLDELSFFGFICEQKDGTYEVIIDPAYMYGVSVPLDCKSEYTINGKKVLMDSVSFSVKTLPLSKLPDKKFGYSDYVYAQMTAKDITVSYDTNGNNYSEARMISYFEPITEDAAGILDGGFPIADKFEEKDDGAAEVYKTLLDNIDIFMAENVVGVNLIDLDFDGMPELLVSKQVLPENAEAGDYGDEQCDVDVYSIKDGEPVYIDTLYNSKANVYANGNVIGLKKTDKLEKKWFYMSRKDLSSGNPPKDGDCDYLFSLENGRLNYTEVFSQRSSAAGSETEDSSNDYYFFGEKIVPEVTVGEGPYEGEEDWEYLSWNGIDATFGMWELYGFIKAEYCSDITPVYDLYSDWLYDAELQSGYNYTSIGKKFNISERSVKYKLAYLVDSYYYGEYVPDEKGNKYWFLGDYAKPVIYLYPEEKTDVSVKLDLDGAITCAYPDYRDGWEITAYPDGTIVDKYDGGEYYCLYWEGKGAADWDMSEGFVVKAEDTADFLRSKLKEIGLTPRESNEFIIYWLPELQKNECNFITFQTEAYEKNAGLEISPAPDSLLRVFMVYEPCSEDFSAEPQEFEPFERNGFTVVEWGGQKK